MQLRNLKTLLKTTALSILFAAFFISCQQTNISKTEKNSINKKNSTKPYVEYMNLGKFNSLNLLNDLSTTWTCYNYYRDNENNYSDDYFFDEDYAKELSRYFYFQIKRDTLIANNRFKIPIYAYSKKLDNLSFGEEEYINLLRGSEQDTTIQDYYFIRPFKNQVYCEYHEVQMEKGDTLPVFGTTSPFKRFAPFSSMFAYYDSFLITSFDGYIYIFKRGQPYNKWNKDIGIPSSIDNRFVVNRTYSNSTIKEAAYKLIEEFPKGTQSFLIEDDEPNEKGEPNIFFCDASFEMYTTKYDWKNPNELTVTIGHSENCTFVFEFVKKGNDVHVKYWNDVVFPFEEGYK